MEEPGITLSTVANGAAEELFQAALKAALENIDDPNTPWKPERVIKVEFRLLTDEDRKAALLRVGVATKLPGAKGVESRIFMGRHKGKLAVREALPQEEMFPEPAGRPVPAAETTAQ